MSTQVPERRQCLQPESLFDRYHSSQEVLGLLFSQASQFRPYLQPESLFDGRHSNQEVLGLFLPQSLNVSHIYSHKVSLIYIIVARQYWVFCLHKSLNTAHIYSLGNLGTFVYTSVRHATHIYSQIISLTYII